MEWVSTFPWTLVGIVVTVAIHAVATYRSHVTFVTKTNIAMANLVTDMTNHKALTLEKIAEHKAHSLEKLTEHKADTETQIRDVNRRLSDLGAGGVAVQTELREFRDHVGQHYVVKDEIADLRSSIDKSIDRMQTSLELATATMGDVRDSVIVLTARNGKSTVPAARRRPPKSV